MPGILLTSASRPGRAVLLLLLALCLGGAGQARAQSSARLQGTPPAYFIFAESGDIAMEVKVWGVVGNAGLYRVPQGMHLSTLLTLAGGPVVMERTGGSERTLILRLVRPAEGGGAPAVVLERIMIDEVRALDEDPVLQDGDIVTVESFLRERFSWRELISIIGSAASVALVIDRLLRG